jgi:Tol biopolymer transport system component
MVLQTPSAQLEAAMRSPFRSFMTALAVAVGAAALAAPAQATYPGVNGRIAFVRWNEATGDNFSLWTANPDGSHQTLAAALPSPFGDSDWSADGRHLAFDFFDASSDEQIAVVDPDGSHLRQLTFGQDLHETPSYSPDGSQIIYDSSLLRPEEPGFHTTLWVMNADGSDQRPLPGASTDAFDVEPHFSPDGRSIAFVRIRKGMGTVGNQQAALLVMRRDGSGVRQLTSWGRSIELGNSPWSPDGRWITYWDAADIAAPLASHTGAGQASRSVHLIHPDGTGDRTLYQGVADTGGARPTFSPDGTKVMFQCLTGEPFFDSDLCVVNSDGTGVVDLTNTPSTPVEHHYEKGPSWGSAPLL